MMNSVDPAPSRIPATARRVLVLQGGGALGSYQAGAYQALCHFDFEPDWIAGISIGAINAAIIAGNEHDKRVKRLKEFWEMVSSPVPRNPVTSDNRGRSLFNETSAALIATFGVPGFFQPRFPPAPLWPPGSPQSQSYYDTAPLRATLERLVDFDRINDLKTRLSVGAVSVTSGNFKYFDNFEFKKLGKKIGPEHIMASGALPPGFPSIEIEGEHYWDGGIATNTPLDYVLDEEANNDLLIFQVDLFSARGPLPVSLLEAAEREKDIRFSSRTRMNTDKNRQIHNTRTALRELIGKLPDYLKNDPSVEILSEAAKENTVTVMHLIYRSKNYESSSKDYDFSHVGMVEHWNAGVRDVHLSMRHKDWLERPQSGATMVTYDLTENGADDLNDGTDIRGRDQSRRTWVDGSKRREVSLLFATTRIPSRAPEYFSGNREEVKTHYGKANVRIPEFRNIGEVSLPFELKILSISLYREETDPQKHFVLQGCEVMQQDTWLEEIRSSRNTEALIFVHGFNVSFIQGIHRCAQIAWDLRYQGIPILFSWASGGGALEYIYDQGSALGARYRFIAVLEDLRKAGITTVHVLAHSMGNYSVLEALSNYNRSGQSLGLGHVLMAAPDVDRNVYLEIAPKVLKLSRGMTLYASSKDRAMALSRDIAREPRAGDIPDLGPALVEGVDTIDASVLGTDIFGLNHGTYAGKSILNDINLLLQGMKAPRLIDIQAMPGGDLPSKWWRYVR